MLKFINDQLNHRFLKDGFVIVDFLNAEDISQLDTFYRSFQKNSYNGIFTSMSLADSGLKKKICHKIWDVFLPHIKKYLVGYSETRCAAFVSKSSKANSEVIPHQDPTYIDEERGFSLNIWAPHSNVDETNGALHVIKKSHQLFNFIRTGNSKPLYRYELIKDCIWDYMEILTLKAGQAVIYDHRLFHASKSNQTDNERIASVCAVYPVGIEAFYYCLDDTDSEFLVEKYSHNTKTFCNRNSDGRPVGEVPIETFTYDNYQISLKEFENALNSSDNH